MLERGWNPELFWDLHTLVLPALQEELRQLTLVRALQVKRMKFRLSPIFLSTNKMPLRKFYAQKHLLHQPHTPCSPAPCFPRAGLALGSGLEREAVQGEARDGNCAETWVAAALVFL